MSKKITYKAMTPDDPKSTRVGSRAFEHGKAVEVDDATYDKLIQNPWFSGDKKAAEGLTMAGGVGPGPDSGIDSSVMVAYPPGSGMKYAPEHVTTEDGMVPADQASDVDGANVLEEPEAAPRGRGRPRSA